MSVEKRGVVLEYHEGSVTVLTPQGEFLSIPWTKTPCPEIGSEIVFNEPAAPKIRFRFTGLAAIAACLLVVFLSVSLWSGVFLPDSRQVVAYVSVDINPSIELGLNKEGKVVKSVGLNNDGELLLQKLALEGLTVDEAVELITQAAVENNYITAEKENTVLITVSEPHKVPEEVKKLEQKVEAKLTANQLSATTQVLEVSGDIRKKAKKLGVSPGKYIVLLEAVDEGLELSVEDIKGDSVVKAIKEAGGVPGEIISKAQQDKDSYKELEKRNAQKLRQIAQQQRSGSEEKGSWAFREKKTDSEERDSRDDDKGRDKEQSSRDSKGNDSDKEDRDNRNSWSGRTGQDRERLPSFADDRDEDENSKWDGSRRDYRDQVDDDNKDRKDSGSSNGNKDKDDGKDDKDQDNKDSDKDNDRDNHKDNSGKKGENVRNSRSSQDKDNDKDNNDNEDKDKEDGSQGKDPEKDSKKTQRQNNLREYTKRFWQWWR